MLERKEVGAKFGVRPLDNRSVLPSYFSKGAYNVGATACGDSFVETKVRLERKGSRNIGSSDNLREYGVCRLSYEYDCRNLQPLRADHLRRRVKMMSNTHAFSLCLLECNYRKSIPRPW